MTNLPLMLHIQRLSLSLVEPSQPCTNTLVGFDALYVVDSIMCGSLLFKSWPLVLSLKYIEQKNEIEINY